MAVVENGLNGRLKIWHGIVFAAALVVIALVTAPVYRWFNPAPPPPPPAVPLEFTGGCIELMPGDPKGPCVTDAPLLELSGGMTVLLKRKFRVHVNQCGEQYTNHREYLLRADRPEGVAERVVQKVDDDHPPAAKTLGEFNTGKPNTIPAYFNNPDLAGLAKYRVRTCAYCPTVYGDREQCVQAPDLSFILVHRPLVSGGR